ncbi:MAG: hypothetical protein R3E39_17615 [Anaerolineae bacterium]
MDNLPRRAACWGQKCRPLAIGAVPIIAELDGKDIQQADPTRRWAQEKSQTTDRQKIIRKTVLTDCRINADSQRNRQCDDLGRNPRAVDKPQHAVKDDLVLVA